MTAANASALEWCSYFDAWRRFEEHGHLCLEPPSGVVTAGDFSAIMRTGVTYASAVMRHTPKPGIYLAFVPSGTWREYQRIRPTLCNGLPGSGATDVVDLDNFDGDERDRTPTPRVGVQTMERVMRGGSSVERERAVCPYGNMPREAGAGHWREWHRGHGCHLDPDRAKATP